MSEFELQKDFHVVKVGGSTKPNLDFLKTVVGQQQDVKSPYLTFGTLVHSIVLEDDVSFYETDETYITLTNTKDHVCEERGFPLQPEVCKLLHSIASTFSSLDSRYVDIINNGKKEIRDCIETKSCFVEHEIEHPKQIEMHPFKFVIRGKLDFFKLEDEGKRAILLDVKTTSKEVGNSASYKSNMEHYATLLFGLYPSLEEIELGLVWIHHENFTTLVGIKEERMFSITREQCKVSMKTRLKELDSYLRKHLSLDKTKLKLPEQKRLLSNEVADFSLVADSGGELVPQIEIDRILHESHNLFKLLTPQDLLELNELAEKYLACIPTNKTKIKASMADNNSFLLQLWRVRERNLNLFSKEPDAYIMIMNAPNKEEGCFSKTCVLDESYHYWCRRLYDCYKIKVKAYFLRDSDFMADSSSQNPIVQSIFLNEVDGCLNFTWRPDLSIVDITRIQEYYHDFKYVVMRFDYEEKPGRVDYHVVRKTDYFKPNSSSNPDGVWSNFPTAMNKKAAIKLILRRIGKMHILQRLEKTFC